MIRILKESFKNLPAWLKPYMKRKRGIISALNDHNIDLYNAKYTDASDITPRDSRWKTGGILVVLLDTGYNKPDLYMWGYDKPESDPYCTDGKYASQHSKSWIIDHAIYIGFISKDQQKAKKDRYRDPRKTYRGYDDTKGEYAGQYKSKEGEWRSNYKRDKSGYVIPDPAKLVGRLYEFNLDNAANTLDNYYKKLSRIKNRIFNIDIRSLGSEYSDRYDNLLRYFGRASQDFLNLEKEINTILKNVGSDKWNQQISKSGMSPEELFQDRIYGLYNKRDLDDYISELQSRLKAIENK